MVRCTDSLACIEMDRGEWDYLSPTIIEDLAVAIECMMDCEFEHRTYSLLSLIKMLGHQVYVKPEA